MKNSNLLNRLLSYSHEKQSPQRFVRYVAMLIMLLTLGVGQMWGAPGARYYLIGDMGTWSKSDDYKIKTQYEKEGKYVIYIYAAKNNCFRLKKDDNSDYGPSSDQSTTQGYGSYNTNAWKYNGNSGIVRFGADETSGDNPEHYPYVFWGKVDIQIKHNWNNAGSWTAYDMTTNSDGTYTYEGVYSGSNATNFGIGSDGSTMKYISSATLTGSPAQGDTVRFVYNSSGYKGFGTETQNTGSATITKLCAIKYNANGATSGSVPSAQTRIIYNTSTTVRGNSGSLAKNGYDFAGWNTRADGAGTTYAAGSGTLRPTAKEIVLYAKWTPHTYTVTYKDKDNETYSGSNGASLPGSYTYGTGIASLTNGIKDGYTFGGWYTASNCSSGRTTSIGTTTYGDKTFYAKWEANITLDANGGDADGSATTIYKSNAKLSITAPTRTGYYVMSYYKEPACTTKVAAADGTLEADVSGFTSSGKWVATEDKTLYPKWDNHYTVTFNQHEPTIAGTANTTATYGSAMPAITVPRKDGYIFGGYYTGTNGSGDKYYNEDGSSAANWAVAANTTLHAKWTGITYHVAFGANGGTGTMDVQDLVYGTSEELSPNEYTRDGYYFLGWNTNADGSGTAYYGGKSVSTMTTEPGATVNLHAQWAQKHTLYFILAGCGWTPPYAKATISYDDQTYYPLDNNVGSWVAMTNIPAGIFLTNVSNAGNHNFTLYKIDNVPEGTYIDFSNNGSSAVGNRSWSADKPYFMYGNRTWYALDQYANPADIDSIYTATNMSAHVGATDYAVYQHTDGQYAIAELSANTWYTLKYHNWLADSWSGCTATGDPSNIITSGTSTGVSDEWKLDGNNNVNLQTTVAGEYKFTINKWTGTAPHINVYFPVGVNVSLDKTEALKGASTTVRFTASPLKTYLMTSPTYYYQMSTNGGSTWTTIGTSSNTTYDYTFAAQTCKFRVVLQNDAGLKSASSAQDFTAYTTKAFYVYNPWYNENWSTLHLYTFDAGDNPYNGSWPGNASGSCVHGNNIVSKGNGWYYITIDERANRFQLVGNGGCSGSASNYDCHKTENCSIVNYIPDAKYMIITESSINKVKEYVAKGNKDFRLKYTYGTKTVYSPIYNTDLDGTTITTSMWLDASQTSTLDIETYDGSWGSTGTSYAIGTSGGGLIDSDHRSHGYVFTMKLNTATPSVSDVAVYDGPFYVRTDGLNGGWNVYKKDDHLMHHSEHSLSGTPAYDHYLCKWIKDAGTNVKFTVANAYNPELVASLDDDQTSTDPLYGVSPANLPTATNVRFAWNSQTNTLTRAYLSAATDASSRFLVMVETTSPQGKIFKEDGNVPSGGNRISGLNDYEQLFADKGNWVYQLVIQAKPGAQAKVTAKYNGQEPEFIPSRTLIGGSGSTQYSYRIVYDFKTNELTSAWVANGDKITTSIELNTNVMLVRNGQRAATQITFGDGISITEAKKVIGVMEFKYNDMVGKMSSWNSTAYQNCMYYFSFPFDVKVSDIFGVGDMGSDWRIQKYNGAKRAEIGWFADTETFWEDLTMDSTMHAYEGYSLLLNRINFNNGSSDVWSNITSGGSVYLYFPSKNATVGTIDSTEQTIKVPSHVCTIDRDFAQDMALPKAERRNHKYTDSNWNMLGSALFQNKTGATITADVVDGKTLNYIYAWNSSDNTLAAQATLGTSFTFNAMHAYLVQFAGTVVFQGASIHPSVAARRIEEKKNYMIELEFSKGETFAGRAYVELRENAVDSFLLNEDMYMLKNSKTADVYTYAGGYDLAANVMTVGNHIVPVGVNVKSAGDYTFSMPSNFSGEVILVDTYNNTRTNLAIEDYVVPLNKGTIDDRFKLEININKVPTAIDGVEDGSLKDGKAHKFIENGAMYILRDGKVFDAQGRQVK